MDKNIIDFNCDLGELEDGGVSDRAILPFVTSVNIACGYHAGNRETMIRTVKYAKEFECNVGAHPGFPDRENFGRTEMHMQLQKIREIVSQQVSELNSICRQEGVIMTHVKPHGALYNMAAKDLDMAIAICQGVKDAASSSTIIVGLTGGKMKDAAHQMNLPFFGEIFSDRGYMPDGTLVPRTQEGALIKDENEVASRVIRMVKHGEVEAIDGTLIPIKADTLCLHGDSEKAPLFAKKIREALVSSGITVKPMQV